MSEKLIGNLLKLLKIPFTTTFLTETVKSVPFKNSFYGLSLILACYKVSTDSVRFKTKGDLSASEMPCIVLYNGSFVILTQVSESEVVLVSPKLESVKVNRTEFENKWDGSALIPILDDHSKEPDYEKHRNNDLKIKIRNLGFYFSLTIIICLFISQCPLILQWNWWSILVTNILGCLVSMFLLRNQLKLHTPFIDKVCGLVKSGDCKSVTQSTGAELFGLFKLSEIGFSFFITNVITLLIFSQAIPILGIISYIVLPFSFWSLWYQRFKAKKWCVLCLCILVSMWVQALLYYFSGIIPKYTIQIYPLCTICFMYLLFYFSVNIIMNVLSRKIKSEHWQSDFINLKSQDRVLSSYFQDDKSLNVESGSGLVFGNPKASVELTVFSNPYCSPCAVMHERLKDIPGEKVKVRYILTYFNEEFSQVNRNIIAAFQQLGEEVTWDILNQWYQKGTALGKDFFEKYKLNIETSDVLAEFHKQQTWAKNNVLPGTPTVLINGREIIWPYSVDDFKLISDIL